MPVIITRPLAGNDLIEIWDYIAEDSEARADAFIDTLDQKLHILAERPNMGRPRDELAKDLRSFPVGRYVIRARALLSICRAGIVSNRRKAFMPAKI